MTFSSLHLSIAIEQPFERVYAFASDPANMPQWAAGLSRSLHREGDVWVADSPMGRVKVRFTEKNAFGVLDHEVTLPSGERVLNPLRAQRNGDGCDVVFTLHRRAGMSEAEFEDDAARVRADLRKLKTLLETPARAVSKIL